MQSESGHNIGVSPEISFIGANYKSHGIRMDMEWSQRATKVTSLTSIACLTGF